MEGRGGGVSRQGKEAGGPSRQLVNGDGRGLPVSGALQPPYLSARFRGGSGSPGPRWAPGGGGGGGKEGGGGGLALGSSGR